MGRLPVVANPLTEAPRQITDAEWSEPWNLSLSGAASQPAIITGPDGQVQAFWWDTFDGITTALYEGESWSGSALAPIVLTSLVGQGANARSVSTPITAIPEIVGDNTGRAHALWLGAPDEETGLHPLLTSRLVLSTTVWTNPIEIAESALIWDMTAGVAGTLHLVYVRTTHTDDNPAGLVYRQSTNNGATWSRPVMLYTSIYFRSLQEETARIQIIADGLGNVLVTSETARLKQPFIIRSSDAGETWTEPNLLIADGLVPIRAYLVLGKVASVEDEEVTANSEILLLWQADQLTTACALYQQRSLDGGVTWSTAERILVDVNFCTEKLSSLRTSEGGILLVTGEGSANLSLSAWNATAGSWSETHALSFAFESPDLGIQVALDALDLQLSGDQLVLAGAGNDNEIWFLQNATDPFTWAFAPPSPWSNPINIADREGFPGLPAVAADSSGHVHVLWSESQDASLPGSTLLYTRWDGSRWSTPIVVVESVEGKNDQPALVVVGDRLHAVWSSGPESQILYSRSYVSDANTAGGWDDAQILSGFQAGNAPVITADLLGRLHVAYAVPVNDGRGIYYTNSSVNGDYWKEPVQIFDAVSEGWLRADYPSLTVDERGTVHIIWVKGPLPGTGLPEAVHYARSTDTGETWSVPFLLAEGPDDHPHLVATLHGQVLAFWRDMRQDDVRYRLTSDSGAQWDIVSTIPGFRDVRGPVGISVDGSGALHGVVLTQGAGVPPALTYASWKDDRWLAGPVWSLLQGPEEMAGAVIAVQSTAGQVDVLLPASEMGGGLWHLTRTVPPVMEVPTPDFTPAPTPTLTPTPNPTQLPEPTLRPILPSDKGDLGMPVLALGPITQPLSAMWGIMLVLLVVGGVLLHQVLKR